MSNADAVVIRKVDRTVSTSGGGQAVIDKHPKGPVPLEIRQKIREAGQRQIDRPNRAAP